jgi:hypothetical protein
MLLVFIRILNDKIKKEFSIPDNYRIPDEFYSTVKAKALAVLNEMLNRNWLCKFK